MRQLSIITIALFAILTFGFSASMLWNIASEGVTVSFELPDEGTKGTVSGLKATIDFDQKDPSASKISASIDIKTLNTGNKQKDDHLKAPDFFDAEKYPTVSFTSSSIKADKNGFIATGTLTMKDSTKIIDIPFTFAEEPNGSGTFKGTMTVSTSDYGVTKKGKSGKDNVVVTLSIPVKK